MVTEEDYVVIRDNCGHTTYCTVTCCGSIAQWKDIVSKKIVRKICVVLLNIGRKKLRDQESLKFRFEIKHREVVWRSKYYRERL